MSMPLQQIARVYKYHKDELNKDEIIFINKMMSNKNALNNYVPKWADEVKVGADSKFLKTKEFVTGYIKLGLKYPETYLNSILIMTSSLWNPFENTFYMEGLPIIMRDLNNLNIKYNDYFKHKNKIFNDYLFKTQLRVNKNNSMALFVLFNQSFLFYIFIFAFIYFALYRLNKYNFIILILLCYAATFLLGPIINFRYTYFFAALIPMLIMMLTNNDNKYKTI